MARTEWACGATDGEWVCAMERGHDTDYHEDVEGMRWPVQPPPAPASPAQEPCDALIAWGQATDALLSDVYRWLVDHGAPRELITRVFCNPRVQPDGTLRTDV